MTLLALLLQAATWRDPITVATVVVAIFTVVSVVVSAFMWSATRKQAQISREIFEAAHRPYVGVDNVNAFIYPGRNGTTLQIGITTKNSGSVPARHIVVMWSVSLLGQDVPREPHVDQAIVLLPEQSRVINTSHLLSGEMYTAFRLPDSLVEIVATIKYKGVTEKDYNYRQHAVFHTSQGVAMTGADFN
jgi:hypothetical protein